MMTEGTFGINQAWQMLSDYRVTYTTDASVFREGTLIIPEELYRFFGVDSGQTRVMFLFEGREYPCYLENNASATRLEWSKALSSKFLSLFPDYEAFFKNLTEYQMDKRPVIQIEKLEASDFMVKMILPEDAALTMKQELFDYLGPGKYVGAFKDSYEMVFLKYYFEMADNRGKADVFMVSAALKRFYENRAKEGKPLDKNADRTIEDIENAGLDVVLAFLMDGPYALFSEKEWLAMETIDEHFYFSMDRAMLDELGTADKQLVVDLLNEKIDYYFERFDGPGLSENMTSWIDEYDTYFTRDFRYSYKDIITEGIPGCIETLKFIDGDRYKVTGFVGDEEWTPVPWVAVLDKNITRVANTGVFIEYILSKDVHKLYLTLSHGFKDIQAEIERSDAENISARTGEALQEAVSSIVDRLDPGSFETDNSQVDLEDERFRNGIICYKEYNGTVPDDTALEEDLQAMLAIYQQYYERCILNLYPEATTETESDAESDLEEAVIEEEETDLPEEETDLDEDIVSEDEDEHEADPLPPSEETEAISENTEQTEPSDAEPQPDAAATSAVSEQKPDRVIEKSSKAKKKKTVIAKPAETVAYAVPEPRRRRAEKRPAEMKEEQVNEPADIKSTLEQIAAYITAHGFNCEPGMVENLYLCLKSKPFVILTGIAGIGKTSFARLFAEAVGATSDNGRYKQVPIHPDWKDSKGLLGYLDMSGHFVPGALNDFIRDAVDFPDKPFFLCLDEMNLSRVEYYFSEILSVMETRRERDGHIMTDPILGDEAFGRDEWARSEYGDLYLPENLYIIGTVSAEESGFNLSRKVLDRASLIEINQVNLHLHPENTQPQITPLSNRFIKSDVLVLANCTTQLDMIQEVVTLLEAMNGILVKANAQIGFRVRDEICFYLLYNAELGLMSQEDGLDHTIVQKILPRIQGGGTQVESALTDLFKICAGTRSNSAVRTYSGGRGGLFPRSAEKLSAMVRLLDHGGKTSFWT